MKWLPSFGRNPPSPENFHRWMFVGGRHIEAPSSLNFVMVRQSSGGQTFERPFVNNPAESVIELINALQLPEWCEKHRGLDRYRNYGAFCRRLAHGRRIDLIVDVEEAEEISLTQLKTAPLALRSDDGAPGIEEVIEHYQTHTPHEETESEAEEEQMEGDYDGDAQDEDPPEEPEQPDDEMPQRSSDSDEWTHGMIFRKGHPVAYTSGLMSRAATRWLQKLPRSYVYNHVTSSASTTSNRNLSTDPTLDFLR